MLELLILQLAGVERLGESLEKVFLLNLILGQLVERSELASKVGHQLGGHPLQRLLLLLLPPQQVRQLRQDRLHSHVQSADHSRLMVRVPRVVHLHVHLIFVALADVHQYHSLQASLFYQSQYLLVVIRQITTSI